MSERDVILSLFESSFAQILLFAASNLTNKMDVLEAFTIKQACDILEGLIPVRDDKDSVQMATLRVQFERLYVFTVMWSIGALLEIEDRCKLEGFLRQDESTRQLSLPAILPGSEDTVFDYMVDNTGESVHTQRSYNKNYK